MSPPIRVQLSRRKGWRMPPNTVSVARPSAWGNPFTTAAYFGAGFKGTKANATVECVAAHRAWLTRKPHYAYTFAFVIEHPIPDLTALRGKNLACWCALDAPCHADTLLELANG